MPNNNHLHDETHLKVLRLLQNRPDISQRSLAAELGVSLGKTNFCLQALLERGLVKAQNIKNNKNKLYYAYLLTPSGIKAKANLTIRFLAKKSQEFELLQAEIEQLRVEANSAPESQAS